MRNWLDMCDRNKNWMENIENEELAEKDQSEAYGCIDCTALFIGLQWSHYSRC